MQANRIEQPSIIDRSFLCALYMLQPGDVQGVAPQDAGRGWPAAGTHRGGAHVQLGLGHVRHPSGRAEVRAGVAQRMGRPAPAGLPHHVPRAVHT